MSSYIISMIVAIIVAVAGGYHDWIILHFGKGKIPGSAKWIGNALEIALVWSVCLRFKYGMETLQMVFLFLNTWITWNIAHDMTMGKKLAGSIWHVGNDGFDKAMREMFQQNGKLYAGVRFGILIIFTLSYIFF